MKRLTFKKYPPVFLWNHWKWEINGRNETVYVVWPTLKSYFAEKFKQVGRIMYFIGWGVLAFIFFYLTFRVFIARAEVKIEGVQPVTIVATVTAYTSSVDETDSTPFITASGAVTHRGIIACPLRYAFGTVVVVGGERYLCEDRMNEKFAERFDVWVPTKTEAWKWGAQELEIQVESVADDEENAI